MLTSEVVLGPQYASVLTYTEKTTEQPHRNANINGTRCISVQSLVNMNGVLVLSLRIILTTQLNKYTSIIRFREREQRGCSVYLKLNQMPPEK